MWLAVVNLVLGPVAAFVVLTFALGPDTRRALASGIKGPVELAMMRGRGRPRKNSDEDADVEDGYERPEEDALADAVPKPSAVALDWDGFDRFTLWELVGVAVPAGFVLLAWTVTACVVLTEGGLTRVPAGILPAVCLFFLTIHLRPVLSDGAYVVNSVVHKLLVQLRDDFGLVLVLAASTYYYYSVFSTHSLGPMNETSRAVGTGGSSYGDLPYHETVIHSFAFGCNKDFNLFDLANPIMAGGKLIYPFLPNLHSAILIVCGFTSRLALFLPNLMLAVALNINVYFLIRRFCWRGDEDTDAFVPFKSRLAPAYVGVIGTFLYQHMGGFGFLFFWKEVNDGGDVDKLLTKEYLDYTMDGDKTTHWLAIVSDAIVTQRSADYAFNLTAAAALFLWSALAGGDAHLPRLRPARRICFLIAGVLIGALPLCQGHAFIALAVVCPLLVVAFWRWSLNIAEMREQFVDWCFFGVPLLLIAIPQLLLYLERVGGLGFGRFEPLWKDRLASGADVTKLSFSEHLDHWWPYWPRQLGVFYILSCNAVLVMNRRQRRFYLPFFALLVVATLYMFSPWQWDNLKLVNVWCFGGACSVASFFHWLLRPSSFRPARAFVAALLIFLCAATGVLSNIRELVLFNEVHNEQSIDVGVWIRENTPHTAVFAAGRQHNNPVSAVAGRQVIAGYPGWLWTHGTDRSVTDQAARWNTEILKAKDPRDAIARSGADYILIGPAEAQQAHSILWTELGSKVYDQRGYIVIKLRR